MAITTVSKHVGAFLSWWGGELAALLPERLRPEADNRLIVSFDESEWLVIGQAGRDGQRELARVDLAVTDVERLRTLLRELGAERLPVALRLGRDQALCRTLTLPLATEENLYEAVAFQLDRHTPFVVDDACFGVRVLRRDTDGQSIEVELAVAPRALVDGFAARLEALGASPTLVCAADGRGDLVLIREEASVPRLGTGRRATPLLTVLALVLGMATVVVPLVQGALAVQAAEADAAELRAEANATAELRRATEQRQRQAMFAIARKRTVPAMETVLAELTRLLPNDTWVARLQIDGGTVHVMGFSGSANSLIAALEQSPLFERAMFRAPLTQDPVHGVEQFHLGVELRARGGT
ncbi:MAG TPA: PilN domain-containing protein [Azospirillum sp.]|nr:PilN domain-containing protein [Azospirillum sp.]